VYCNRTLNLRAIQAIGYDMDYTLVHYHVEEWERRAYEFLREKLLKLGWPVQDLQFDPECVTRGLIIDLHLGNVVKADRFGYVKRAVHGGRFLEFDEQRRTYSRTVVDLADPRWVFLNTLFSISEACIYTQLVDRLDEGQMGKVLGYADLYRQIRHALDEAHMEGALKRDILADPERFVVMDEQAPRALLDQRESGKKLLLITNSEWDYTRDIMRYAFDSFLPGSMTWKDLFELVVVSARKPVFFVEKQPVFEVDEESGLLRPTVGGLDPSRKFFLGGSAALIEEGLGLDGNQILYVGDHIYSDVHVSKAVSRWRTAVILRELEEELECQGAFGPHQRKLDRRMVEKVDLEAALSKCRLELQRRESGHESRLKPSSRKLRSEIETLRERLVQLDDQIAPLAMEAGGLWNRRWGLLMRAGSDKSHLARQIERHADIYTSRVSNFLFETPFAYFRSHRGSLPHDLDMSDGSAQTVTD
jgi:HAD superfamily 5'-nucleotidase-like hydrolase